MSRQKKEKKFLEHGGMNEGAMIAYLNNELDAQEKQQFEKLLKDDPFAQEALEGLQLAQNKKVTETLSSINRKVKERIGVKEKKALSFHWSNYAWAAVLLGLLIGIGGVMVLYMGKEDSNIAMNEDGSPKEEESLFETKQELKPAESSLPAPTDSLQTQQTFLDTVMTANAVGSENKNITDDRARQDVYTYNIPATPETKTLSVPPATPEKIATKVTTPAAEPMKTKSESLRDVKTESLTTVRVPVTEKVVRGSIVEREETGKVTVVTMDDAMKSFNSGNYKQASEYFDAILQKQPNNADALYFGAMSEYINGNYKRSEKNFDKLLSDGTKYADGSKWYKANILLQKGKRDEARKLLDELSQSGGSYKERAIKKKAELEF
jgi:tetratricopeptide (TPR) repeat protein